VRKQIFVVTVTEYADEDNGNIVSSEVEPSAHSTLEAARNHAYHIMLEFSNDNCCRFNKQLSIQFADPAVVDFEASVMTASVKTLDLD